VSLIFIMHLVIRAIVVFHFLIHDSRLRIYRNPVIGVQVYLSILHFDGRSGELSNFIRPNDSERGSYTGLFILGRRLYYLNQLNLGAPGQFIVGLI